MRLLRSYILKLHLVPFLLGFGVVTFILVMDVLFDYLDLVVNRGVAVGVVLQLYLLSLGYIVALSLPCAVLVCRSALHRRRPALAGRGIPARVATYQRCGRNPVQEDRQANGQIRGSEERG